MSGLIGRGDCLAQMVPSISDINYPLVIHEPLQAVRLSVRSSGLMQPEVTLPQERPVRPLSIIILRK